MNKKLWLAGVMLLLAVNLSAAATILDEFEDISRWQPSSTPEVGFKVTREPGFQGDALCFNYDFSKVKGYVLAAKDINVTLPDNYDFSFFIKGETRRNIAFEFKLIDRDGNTYWRKTHDFEFPNQWKKITIEKDEITFAWGPSGGSEIKQVKRIEFAVSTENTGSGSGRVWIDQFTITDVPLITLKLDPGKIKVTASATENNQYKPLDAFDDSMLTRWSSPASDPQWLMLDLGNAQDVSGLIIYWESAYGADYDVQISLDNSFWKTVSTVKGGDGGTDFVNFTKQPARYIRIFGHKRGTTWGYSIYEVKVMNRDWPPKTTLSSNSADAGLMFDGDMTTIWQADGNATQSITLDLSPINTLGGLVIDLDNSPVTGRTVSISDNGIDWQQLIMSRKPAAEIEHLYLPEFKARYIKVDMTTSNPPLRIKDITLKGADEKLTPQKSFEIAAMQSPKGYYPLWLSRMQEYWTITGAVDDTEESLLSENGVVEPWHRGHTMTPVLKLNGSLVTYGDVKTEQSLLDGCLPIPSSIWRGKDIDLTVEAFTADAGQKSSTYLSYTVTNKTDQAQNGTFYLMLRPLQLNPPWMGGGLAEISTIHYAAAQSPLLSINNRAALFIPEPPDIYSPATFKRPDGFGDIIEDISTGKLPAGNPKFTDLHGLGSAALAYTFNLKSRKSVTYYFAVPLHNNEHELDLSAGKNIKKIYTAKRAAIREFWLNKLSSIRIELPDPEFINTLKANIAYILINDDMLRLQPGSRNYNASWMRDGSISAIALLTMGITNEVKRYLNWISGFVKDDGWVPFIIDSNNKPVVNDWKEFDSQGQYLYSLLQYYLFTGDREFLADKKQRIINNINYIKARRAERMTPEYQTAERNEFYGIFPESQSHEGYINPPRHSYWDDFWGIRGLADAGRIFAILGDREKSDWAKAEGDDLRKCAYQSIAKVQQKHKIDYIPGCAELGDFDATSTANSIWPCNQLKYMPEAGARRTFEIYWDTLKSRFNDTWTGGFTPYELRIANPFLMLGQRDRLHAMISKFFEWKRPRNFNHWAEVVTADYRIAQYLGDMPHTWIGAEYVNIIRNMLIFEDDLVLYLGKGIAAEWIAPGKIVSVTDMPTHFGNVSYRLETAGNTVTIDIAGTLTGMDRVIFVLPPLPRPAKSVSVNRGDGIVPGEEIELLTFPSRIVIRY